MESMFESPILQEFLAGASHRSIVAILKARFGTVPRDMTRRIRKILDEKKLTNLVIVSAKCPDMQAFRDALPS
jgi:hypothetical protein